MRWLVLQHIEVEHPGSWRDFMRADGVVCDTVELDAGEAIPSLEGYDALICMGGPMDVFDEAAVSYQIVLTKTDKIKPPAVKRITEETLQAIMKRPAAFPRVVATTSAKGDGIDVLRAEIAALLPEF